MRSFLQIVAVATLTLCLAVFGFDQYQRALPAIDW